MHLIYIKTIKKLITPTCVYKNIPENQYLHEEKFLVRDIFMPDGLKFEAYHKLLSRLLRIKEYKCFLNVIFFKLRSSYQCYSKVVISFQNCRSVLQNCKSGLICNYSLAFNN